MSVTALPLPLVVPRLNDVSLCKAESAFPREVCTLLSRSVLGMPPLGLTYFPLMEETMVDVIPLLIAAHCAAVNDELFRLNRILNL